MEILTLLLNNHPEILYGLLASAAIGLIISLCKKAMSLAAVIFVISFAATAIQPMGMKMMEQHGVSLDGTVISITTQEGDIQSFDLENIASFDIHEEESGACTVFVEFYDNTQQTFVVPADAVSWIKTGLDITGSISQAGADFANEYMSQQENGQ